MSEESFINILVVEDNDVSRQMMTSVLEGQGYSVFGAGDGNAALDIIREKPMDMTLVDINMAPMDGFEFMKTLLTEGIKTSVIVVTGGEATDMLVEANSLGAVQVLNKPVTPDRLICTVERFLKKQGYNVSSLGVSSVPQANTSDKNEIMEKVLKLAADNAKSGKGGPFSAIIIDGEGTIIGQGTNSPISRADPVGHAEVMAVRQAAEKLERTKLDDCTLYCACAPTSVGEALIASVGITKVYYALSHDDIRGDRPAYVPAKVEYIQIAQEEGLKMLKGSEA